MAELGIIASVVQIADVGLRLSIKLYTFGEIVASADRSVISISKDVSLTSGVLKELGQLLDKDKETRTFSENAVQTADGVVKECLEVFQEMENILVKKMPSLAKGEGRDGKSGERTKRAVVMLERLKWGYLQPKLQLLRSNLDRLKSTLLLMLNVITYARQVSGKSESPSVIAEQRSLIEDLAHSNQDYVRKFEEMKLGIEGPAVEHVNDAPNIGAIETGPSTTTRSLPGAPTPKFGRTRFATRGLPLQENESTRSISSRELTAATRSPQKAQSNVARSLATLPNAAVGNALFNTSVQTNIAMPPVQERGIPTTEAPRGFEQEALFKQLEHYSVLIQNLLKEVDEAQYKITLKSRLRVKGGIAGLHESERQELERIWGGTALQSAEQRLESLVEGLGEMRMKNKVAARDPGKGLSSGEKGRKNSFLPVTANFGLDKKEQEEAAVWLPQPIPDGPLFDLNSGTEVSTVEDPPNVPLPVDDAVAKEGRLTDVSEDRRTPSETTAGAYRRGYPVANSAYYLSDKKHIRPSNLVPNASTDKLRDQGPGPQRNDMPPPQAVPNAAANGRLASPTAPPTPQTTSKANPKGKKDARERKKPTKKGSTASVPPTPASEVEQPPTPTPATPVTPQHLASFAPSKGDGQGQANMMTGMATIAPDQLAPQQQDTAMSGFKGLDEGIDESYSMPFNSGLNNPDMLENFDFEHFLETTDGDFNFDPSTFQAGDGPAPVSLKEAPPPPVNIWQQRIAAQKPKQSSPPQQSIPPQPQKAAIPNLNSGNIEIGGGPITRGPLDLEQSSRETDTPQFENAERVVNEDPESRWSMDSQTFFARSKGDRDTSPERTDEHSSSRPTRPTNLSADVVSSELMNNVQQQSLTQSPDLARQRVRAPKMLTQLHLQKLARRKYEQSTSTPGPRKFQKKKRTMSSNVSPIPEKKMREDQVQETIENREREHMNLTSSDRKLAVNEADLRPARASSAGPEYWDMSPSLGGIHLEEGKVDYAQAQAHSYGQHPHAPHMQAYSNVQQNPTITSPPSLPSHIQHQSQTSTILPSQGHSYQAQQPSQANHSGLNYPQSYVGQPNMHQQYNITPGQAAATATAAASGQQSYGYPIPPILMAESPRMGGVAFKNERTSRSPPQVPNSIGPLSSQVSQKRRMSQGYLGHSVSSSPHGQTAQTVMMGHQPPRNSVLPQMRPPPQHQQHHAASPKAGPTGVTATDSHPQLPPIQGLGLAIDILPPRKDDVIHEHGSGFDPIAEGIVEESRGMHQGQQVSPPPTSHSHNPSFDQFLGQQQDAIRHQEAGQVVVPASLKAPPHVRGTPQTLGFLNCKHRRVAACTACRHQKFKCDRTRPKCVHCEQSESECIYNDGKKVDQGPGSDASSHIETDLERPSQALSPTLPPNWQIARANSAAPTYFHHSRPAVQQGGSFLASAAGAEYENPIPSQEYTHPFAAARVDRAGTTSLSEPEIMPRRLSFDDGGKATLAEEAKKRVDQGVLGRTDPAASRIHQLPAAGAAYGYQAQRDMDRGQRQRSISSESDDGRRRRRHRRHKSESRSRSHSKDVATAALAAGAARLAASGHEKRKQRRREKKEERRRQESAEQASYGQHPDHSLHLDDNLEWPALLVKAPGHPTSTLSPSALAKPESRETQVATTAATSIQDPHIDFNILDSVSEREKFEPRQRQNEQGESRLADMEVADRLVLLWTTVKPL